MNILIPACGDSKHFQESYWPQNIVEIKGKPMIQYVVENFVNVEDKKYIFVLDQKECNKFHTDNVVKLITDDQCEIIKLAGKTGGALCTCLMAIQYIDTDDELIICNCDQKFDNNMEEAIGFFRNKNMDAGVICFDCVHPRWSYVRMEGENVVEAAEKRPISRNAIAGFYYFKNGKDFVCSAKKAMLKGSSFEDRYYITAALNEMVLAGKRIGQYTIDNEDYHSFYSPEKIKKYERGI